MLAKSCNEKKIATKNTPKSCATAHQCVAICFALLVGVLHVNKAQADSFLGLTSSPGSSPFAGESVDSIRNKWIKVDNWGYGVKNPSAILNFGSGVGGGTSDGSRIDIVKPIDRSSPRLFQALVTGETIGEATLVLDVIDSLRYTPIEVKLTHILITNISTVSSSTELITIVARCVETISTIRNASGQISPPTSFQWNFARNEEGCSG